MLTTAAVPSDAAAAWVKRLQAVAAARLPDEQETEVEVAGAALHMGIEMEWSLTFDRQGSFVESLVSPQMIYEWGYDASATPNSAGLVQWEGPLQSGAAPTNPSYSGSAYTGPGGVCWASDDAGCPRQMQLDDEEALLLSTWVRTGVWVLPGIAAQLDIAAVPRPRDSSATKAASRVGNAAWVELRLRGGGQVIVLLELCTTSWLPLSMRLQLAGSEELWELSDWRQWQPGLWLAGTAVQSSSGEGGVINTYHACTVKVREAGCQMAVPRTHDCLDSRPAALVRGDDNSSTESCSSSSSSGSVTSYSSSSHSSSGRSRFAPPSAPLMPADSSFLPGVPEDIQAWYTVSGHSLVQPLLNGRPVGYFIFDTGASGFVLDRAVAEELGLEAFGELQVTSMVGKVASRFRRASNFQLGPLRIERPLLMELPCQGLVSGVPEGGRVAGILGHDVLRRAVVHLPPQPRRTVPAATAAAAEDVDSPAAAVAAALSAAQARRAPLPLTIRLQHPASPAAVAGSCLPAAAGTASATAALQDELAVSLVAAGSESSAGGTAAATATVTGGSVAEAPSSTGSIQLVSRPDSPSASKSITPSSSSPSSSGSSKTSTPLGPLSSVGQTSISHDETQQQQQKQAHRPLPQLQLQQAAGSSGAASTTGPTVSLKPGSGNTGVEPDWLPLVMVAGLPHVELELVTTAGLRHSGLFMLDSGAGGFDVIVNPTAAQSLGLGGSSGKDGSSFTQIKGIGGSDGGRLSAQRCHLAQARLGAFTFRPVTAVYHQPSGDGRSCSGGLVLSKHTSGIVCAGLLGRCSLLFDYARMRMAVLGADSMSSRL